MGLVAASVGMYPLAYSGETRVSGSARYGVVADSMRMLARREPTLAPFSNGRDTGFASAARARDRVRRQRRVKRQRQVGNSPQAFSHLTLISAAHAIAAAEGAARSG